MIMFIIILSAKDVVQAKLHVGIVLLPVYIILDVMIYIVCSGLLKLFSKEKKELVLVLFTGN